MLFLFHVDDDVVDDVHDDDFDVNDVDDDVDNDVDDDVVMVNHHQPPEASQGATKCHPPGHCTRRILDRLWAPTEAPKCPKIAPR